MVGLLEWGGRFVEDGGMGCHVPQRFLRKLARMQHRRTRWVPRAVWQAFDRICGQVESGALREHLADPTFWYPGDAVATNASTNWEWGVVAGPWVAYGRWTERMLAALRAHRTRTEAKVAAWEAAHEASAAPEPGEVPFPREVERTVADGRERISISPAELAVHGFGVKVVWKLCAGAQQWNGQFYSRCDNMSAVMVMDAGRARAPGMAEALVIVREAETGGAEERRLKSLLQHIGTLDSKVADLLSRGDVEEAKRMVVERSGYCTEVALPEAYLREVEDRLSAAFSRDAEGAW